jgi:hypothetical protein
MHATTKMATATKTLGRQFGACAPARRTTTRTTKWIKITAADVTHHMRDDD